MVLNISRDFNCLPPIMPSELPWVPPPLLVGIEPNPGPIGGKKTRAARKKAIKKAVKQEVVVVREARVVKARAPRRARDLTTVSRAAEMRVRDKVLYNQAISNPGNFGGGVGTTVARIDNFFDSQLIKKLKMGKFSRMFLRMVLDPMHDTKIDGVGWPDQIGEPSIVRRIPQEMAIAYPTDNPNFLGTPWNAHVILNPWLNSLYFSEFSRFNNNIYLPFSASTFNIGGLQVWACNPPLDFAYGGDPTSGDGTIPTVGQLLINDPYSTGAGRLVSLGVELIDTTNVLHTQGSITSWRAPQPYAKPSSWNATYTLAETDLVTAVTAVQFRYPPQNTAQAFLYDGTREWKYEHGCYMIATFIATENPPLMVDYTQPWISAASAPNEDQVNRAGVYSPNNGPVWFPTLVDASADPMAAGGFPGVKLYPINQMGMILEGLDSTTTFKVKMTAFYETFPSIVQADIVTMARDNCPHDPACLELLAQVYERMMISVQSKENFDGEWWANVVEWIGRIAGIGASVFGLPGVGLATEAGTLAAGKVLRSYQS